MKTGMTFTLQVVRLHYACGKFGSADAQTSYNDLIDTMEGIEDSSGRSDAAKWLSLAHVITAHRPIRCIAASSMLDIIALALLMMAKSTSTIYLMDPGSGVGVAQICAYQI